MSSERNVRIVDIEEVASLPGGPTKALDAWGYCYLKVQQGDETIAIRVKVVSVPQELIDTLNRRAPRPPAKTLMIDATSDEGRRLNLQGQGRQRVIMPDYSDPDYLEKEERHQLDFRREVVGRGVASKLQQPDGSPATTSEELYAALETNGLSGLHFAELAKTIMELTAWSEEERERFLTPPSGSSRAK